MKLLKYLYSIAFLIVPFAILPSAHAQNHVVGIDQAVNLTLERNRLLAVSDLEKAKSREQLKESTGLALPTISLSASYLHYFQKQVSFLPGSFVGLGDNQIVPIRVGGTQALVSSLNLVQPIYNPTANAGIKSARINETAKTQEWLETKNNVVANVKKAYLDVLIVQEQWKLQKQSISRNELALKDSRSLMAQGRASRADTLRAYVSLQNLRPELYRLEKQIDINKTLLRKAIGLNDPETIELSDSLIIGNLNLNKENVNPADALQTRPEVLAAVINENYQASLIKKEVAARLPVFSLIGALQAQSQANNLDVSKYNVPMTSYLGVQLYVPVVSGFRNIYRTRQAKLALLQSKKQAEETKADVKTEAEISLSKLEEAKVRIVAQQEVVISAQLGFQLTNDRFKQGISSRLELADAELALSTAKSNYLQAVYDYQVASIALERALGIIIK